MRFWVNVELENGFMPGDFPVSCGCLLPGERAPPQNEKKRGLTAGHKKKKDQRDFAYHPYAHSEFAMPNIAVVGSGISGLTCAWRLSQQHNVTLFEAQNRLGGHTHTHDIEVSGRPVRVDTGFIVFNERTYPHFIQLLDSLGCSYAPTEMSFSVQHKLANLEYNGHNLGTLFCQKRNLFRPRFYSMLRDILRFNREARTVPAHDTTPLDEYLETHRYGAAFREWYLGPMAAAIWSTGNATIGQFPIGSLASFYNNHGLLDIRNRPRWFVIAGGSDTYVDRMRTAIPDVRVNTPVRLIRRSPGGVHLSTDAGVDVYDDVVIATHSDEALAMLADPTPQEREILGAIRYTNNDACLHLDASKLPCRRKAWASWNYQIDSARTDRATLTYNMNILQGIDTASPVLVSLNEGDSIEERLVIKRMTYAHPLFDQQAMAAQARRHEISGVGRTHYAGAYWGYGFHEDGVVSAFKVCDEYGTSR